MGGEGIEPSTSALSEQRSATELAARINPKSRNCRRLSYNKKTKKTSRSLSGALFQLIFNFFNLFFYKLFGNNQSLGYFFNSFFLTDFFFSFLS